MADVSEHFSDTQEKPEASDVQVITHKKKRKKKKKKKRKYYYISTFGEQWQLEKLTRIVSSLTSVKKRSKRSVIPVGKLFILAILPAKPASGEHWSSFQLSNGFGVRSNGFGVRLSGSWNLFERFIRSVRTALRNRSCLMSNCLNGFGSCLNGLASRLLSVCNPVFCPLERKSIKVRFPRAGHIYVLSDNVTFSFQLYI